MPRGNHLSYLRDPAAISARSFEIIRAEAFPVDLPPDIARIALRVMHASGMTDLVHDLRYDPSVARRTEEALRAGMPVITDCMLARTAINAKELPAANEILCTLNDPAVPDLAAHLATTRSAAAVTLWQPRLKEAVVVIGNAPTALFALLEGLDAGWPKPAAIIAFPVGFVGAAESKQALAEDNRGVPYITLLGRRGGSAMAGAALNALIRSDGAAP
jgi:precorrin-8X/cobalt-precorrin-8 methylmutase